MAEHTDGRSEYTEGPEPTTPGYPEHETRRATGMGNPGRFSDDPEREPGLRHDGRDGGAEARVRHAAGSRIAETADRVRVLGDRAAEKNRFLSPTRPLARGAAQGMDTAAEYVRSHPVTEMRDDLESQVRRHPLAAIAVAFLAGYTLRRVF